MTKVGGLKLLSYLHFSLVIVWGQKLKLEDIV